MKEQTTLRYLTDAAFEITTGEGVLVIDLGEFTPIELLSPGIVGAIITHQHSDHCDRAKLAKLAIPVWAPADTVPLLSADGVKETRTLLAGSPMKITESTTVTPIPVRHGPHAKPFVNFGLVIEINGQRIWHTGALGMDNEPHPTGPFDLVAFGIGGTYIFDAEAAGAYLDALGHEGTAIAMHWDYAPEMGQRFLDVGHDASWTPLLLNSGDRPRWG